MPIDTTKLAPLTREQAAVIGLYTGILCGPFSDVHELAENVMGRPIWTHQFPGLEEELKQKCKDLFLSICHEG